MNDDADRLDDLAATQIIDDAEVAHCWGLVREGIRDKALGIRNLGRLLKHLRAGNGMGFNELSIEVASDGSDLALVALLDDERTCPATKLIAELERLLERAGGKAGDSPPSPPDGGTPPPAGPSSELPPSGADVAGTMAALRIDTERFATALRTVAEWLESRTPEAGAAVDRMIAALDEAAGPLLGGVDRTSRDAERDTRARNAARAAIAARLGPRPGSVS
jgi:hypothetical protein